MKRSMTGSGFRGLGLRGLGTGQNGAGLQKRVQEHCILRPLTAFGKVYKVLRFGPSRVGV